MALVIKMSHRFFYVYEIKGDINELYKDLNGEINSFNDSPIKIDGTEFSFKFKEPKIIESMIQHYYFNNQEEILGNIDFKNRSIPFKIRSESKLLFVETPFQREKLIILKFFNNAFKNFEIELFVPNNEEEKDFICNTAKYEDFKVFIGDKIVRYGETEEDLCEGLMNDMELIEVTLSLDFHNHSIMFYYYGYAIQFPHLKDEEIEGVIQTFENSMIAQSK